MDAVLVGCWTSDSANKTCPESGAKALEILWGLPDTLAEEGFAIGGCIYNPATDPDFVCPECDHEWRLDNV